MAYTNRTCHHCGYRAPQPHMHKQTVKINVGSSSPKLSKRTVATSLLGSKSGTKQVQNWFSGNTSRQYTRNRQVWLCNDCISYYSSSNGEGFLYYLKGIFWVTVVFLVIGLFFSEPI
jgi:hypothetical protein